MGFFEKQDFSAVRMEDVFYEKLELKKEGSRQNNLEHLGQAMQDAANEFGVSTPYGSALNRVSQTEFKLGTAEREFLTNSANNTLLPIRRFLEGDMRTIQKERKILQGKRLDLDSCKNRLKKAKTLETQAVVSFKVQSCKDCFSNIRIIFKQGTKNPPGFTLEQVKKVYFDVVLVVWGSIYLVFCESSYVFLLNY